MIALLPNCGFLSETSRMLAIGQALVARGQPVVFATHGGPFAHVIEDAGFALTRIEPAMDSVRCERYVRDLVQIGRPGVRLQPPDEVRASVQAEARFLRAQGAKMAVIGFTLTAYLSSRVVGIPLASSHGGSYVPPVIERGLAPVPTQMPIPGTEWLPRAVKRWFANTRIEKMEDPVQFLNVIAAELGVEPVPTLASLLVSDLTMVTDVPEVLGIPIDALEAWHPRRPKAYRSGTRLTYTGPLFARLPLPVPESVERFLDGRRPTVYVVLSSSTPQMLRAVAQRVRAAGPRVIVGATIHDFGPVVDPDIVVAALLPSHAIMPRVDLVVCMGGQGTVQTAMASGTPVIGIPLHAEQELNVDLAARQGMGLAIAPRHARTEAMTNAVQRILGNPGFRTQAQRVRGLYEGVDGAGNAAAAILRYLALPNASAAVAA
jgi:UDP:flavonoid glycosyltransferase YjiC (YdhE family)